MRGLIMLGAVPLLLLGLPAPAFGQDGAAIRTCAPANMLRNGGFEQPGAEPGQPAAWSAEPDMPGAVLRWDRHVAHSGRHSVRISFTEPNHLTWLQTVPVQPDTAYRLTGWIKTRNVARAPDSPYGGAFVAFREMFDRPAPMLGTHDWTQVGTYINSGDYTTLDVVATLGFYSGGTTGTAWFDDFVLTPASGVEHIVNGGFEQGRHTPGALPADWGTVDNGSGMSAFKWDSTIAHSGRQSVRVKLTERYDAFWVQMFRVEPHTLYRLSGWIKTLNVAHSQESQDVGANLSFWFTWDHSPPLVGTQDWTYVSVVTDSGDAHFLIAAARLGFWSGTTTGTAWFDDLTLTRVNNS